MPLSLFSKPHRVLKSKEFTQVLNGGTRHQTRNFIFYLYINSKKNHRLGMIVTRKVSKAVGRNRVKRLLREYFRLYLGAQLNEVPSLDFIVIAKRGSTFLDLEKVRREFHAYFTSCSFIQPQRLSENCFSAVAQ